MAGAFQNEVDLLLPVVGKAGDALLGYFNEKNYQVEEKSKNNPVTDADFAANEIILEALASHFPNDGILSEEGAGDRAVDRHSASRVWIIDPLDGTREFIDGEPHFAFSLGLAIDGEPVLGFLYNPASDQLVYGGIDQPVLFNNKPVTPLVTTPAGLSETRLCLSRTEQKKGLFDYLIGHVSIAQEQIIGSVAYKLALVAANQYDLIISRKPKNEWDIAGGMGIFAGLGYELYDGSFEKIDLNKKDTKSDGLVGGRPQVIKLYREFLDEYEPF